MSLKGGDLLHGGRTLEPLLQVTFTDLTVDEAEELQARLNALLATKKATNEFLEKHDLGDIDAESKPTVQVGVTSPSPPPTPPPPAALPLLPLSEDEFVAIDDSALNLAGTGPTSGFFDELGGATDVEWVIVAATIVAMLIGLRVAVIADDAVVHASSPVGCLTASAFAPLASHHLLFPFFSVPGRTASRAQQAMTTFLVLAAELIALGFFLGAPTAGAARPLRDRCLGCAATLPPSPSSPS